MADKIRISSADTEPMASAEVTSVFARLQGRLRGVAKRLLRDDDDAADAVQEAFCRLWTRRDRINTSDGGNAEALTMTTVRNVCIDMLRRQAIHPEDSIDDKGIENKPLEVDDYSAREASVSERVTQVYATMDAVLQPRQREMLIHRDRDGWSVEELADYYHLSEANVRTIISRARKAVREAYVSNNLGASPSASQK